MGMRTRVTTWAMTTKGNTDRIWTLTRMNEQQGQQIGSNRAEGLGIWGGCAYSCSSRGRLWSNRWCLRPGSAYRNLRPCAGAAYVTTRGRAQSVRARVRCVSSREGWRALYHPGCTNLHLRFNLVLCVEVWVLLVSWEWIFVLWGPNWYCGSWWWCARQKSNGKNCLGWLRRGWSPTLILTL